MQKNIWELLARVYWPKITDLKSAKAAALYGLTVSLWVAGVTTFSVITHFLEFSSSVDVVIFLILGWGIYKLSRTAAVLALIIYVWGQADYWLRHGSQNWFMVGILALFYIHSIRGTFVYHRLYKKELKQNVPEIKSKKNSSSFGKASLMVFVVILLVNLLVYLLENKTHLDTSSGTTLGAILGTTVVLGSSLGAIAGITLSIIGICQRNRKKILLFIGLLLNSFVLFITLRAINTFSKMNSP